jgi:predicted ATPase
MSAPSGVVTFLFTDIEGSTRRWESDADLMRVALAAHDKALRSAVEAHDGFVFSHSGDGMAAAFSSPMAAVEAAVDAQRELDLPVRMGIATGEAELRDNDYFGTVLNRAARIMAAGHGGQILLAESTAGLLSGVDLAELGPRRLRDLPSPLNVFQVRAPGLRTDFPSLRTLDPTPGNLRRAASAIVGRDAELADIIAAVRSRRMVTLTGVGGVGKTRLALEVAARLSDEFPDGVWLFEFGAVNDPAAVPEAVAAVLGITQQPGKTVSESIAAALEGRIRLLVFDNCEHVLDATADLAEAILAESETTKVLATSREGLALADEQVWPVRSLAIDAAVDLFTARAHYVAPALTFDDASVVGDICRRLDGIPLAIELAASRTSSMAVDEIRDHLDHRFKLLVGSRRALGRHQTLRHAVAWSYDLLDDSERLLLERCSVFAGGFDLESVCAVAGSDTDRYRIVDMLDALVRKSLIVAEQSSGRTRFSLLETIREFADEKLADRGVAQEVRDAHARHYANLEPEIMALWDSPRQREAYAWFGTELANLRNAFRWAADHNDLDTAATIATFVGLVGFFAENYEPSTWAEELIEAARSEDHSRLSWLYQVASVCYMTGRIEQGLAYSEAIPLTKRDGCVEVPFGLEGLAGGVYLLIGQPERYSEWCRDYLDRDTHGLTRSALVNALVFAGSAEQAIIAANGLVEVAEATGNPWALSYALLSVGFAYRDADPARALEAARRGLVTAHDSGNRFNESHLASLLSLLEAEHGDPLIALDYITLASRDYQDAGSVTFYHSSLAPLALILDRLGHFEAAAVIASYAALSPMAVASFPQIPVTIAHIRECLGTQTYDALARKGTAMTPSAMVTYAFEQIDQARAALEQLA